jgi:diguanylate cyclase (GGDEF)-like protein
MPESRTTLPDATYLELVRSLYATLLPTVIIAVSFIGVGGVIALETPDPLLDILILLGMLAVLARLGNLLRNRARVADRTMDVPAARILERRFAFFYFCFAASFGAFSARAFMVATPEAHMLVVGLVFGYAAGVAVGISLRPWIAVTSLVISIAPVAVVTLLTPSPARTALALLLLLFLAGGIHSVLHRFRKAAYGITMWRAFETLARADALTGLHNRFSLREDFDRFMARTRPAGILVVHCLDLDRFKPVNDAYGHPVGDALLRAVSDRLSSLLRQGDIAARIGGDEFVVLQTGASHPGEADMLARRMSRAIARPFPIEGHEIKIGTSVGYALSPDHGRDLDVLIANADEALCHIKRQGGGICAYAPVERASETRSRRLSA